MKHNSDKNLNREVIQARLNSLTQTQRTLLSDSLCHKLREWPVFQACRIVVSFYPMRVEPAIVPLLRACGDSKVVALVRTPDAGEGLLELYRWDGSDAELESHPSMPLRQIRADRPLFRLENLTPAERSGILVLVPGLGFTAQGARLGRGKGWYDRFLAAWPEMIRAAVGFETQIVEELPQEPWDEKLDYVVSEERVINCPPRR